MGVITRGARELSLRFDTFPAKAQANLQARITSLTEDLAARIEEATPVKTGLLKSEITPKVYGQEQRAAGYVSVFAGENSQEYAKAATLEYGTDKPRKAVSRIGVLGALLSGRKQRLAKRISRPVHLEARRYLSGPFEEMRPEIEAALNEALEDAIDDDTQE